MGADYADYAGFTGVQAPTAQNPTLVPNFDPLVASGDGAAFLNTAEYLGTYQRQPATSTITFTGSATAGDTAYIDFFNNILPGGFLQVSTLVVSGDTLATIAQRLLIKINTNPVLAARGVTATYSLVASDPTLTLLWPGPVGNVTGVGGWSFVTSATATIGGTVTDTDIVNLILTSANLPNGLQLTLGGTATEDDVISLTFENPSLPNGKVVVDYTVLAGATLATVATALAVAVNAETDLDGISLTANATSNRLYVTWGAGYGTTYLTPSVAIDATETVTLATVTPSQPSALVPTAQGSETITIGGTATEGDVIKITIAASAVTPNVVIEYTVDSAETTTTIADAIATLIDENEILAAAGFSATNAAAVITVLWSTSLAGQVSFAADTIGVTTETFSVLATTYGTSSVLTISNTSGGADTTTTIATALRNAINANVILLAMGMVATSSGAVVTMNWAELRNYPFVPTGSVSDGATETITISALYAGQTITVGGTATATDKIWAEFTTPELGEDDPVQVSFTVTAGLTTTQMAAGLAAAINADPDLAAAGITASPSSAVITIREGSQQPTIRNWATGA